MFLETKSDKYPRGWIEVICGSMFSGKTEELIRRLTRAQFAKQKIQVFKPILDKRFDTSNIVSHQGNKLQGLVVKKSSDIVELIQNAEVVGIDEAQFFDEQLPSICTLLANKGIRVIVAGLDLDYTAAPFGSMPQLMAIAEQVTKVQAICVQCSNFAYVSHRKIDEKNLVVLGETDIYEPLCRDCYNKRSQQ
jgi:thymidine kinase